MKGGVKMIFEMIIILIILISLLVFVIAGPYGYGDSMDLKYKIVDNKIVYGYGDSTKYVTSLRPSNMNLSEWRKSNTNILRREAINLTWEEIDKIIKNNQAIEEALKDKQNNHFAPLNNVIASLANKVTNLFLGLIGKESISVKTENNVINNNKMCCGRCG